MRNLFFANLWRLVSGLVGVFQAAVLHWVWVVAAGWPSPGALFWSAVVLALFGANLFALPWIRRARQGRGFERVAAQAYMAVGLTTLGGGFVVALSWLLLFPLSRLAGAFGAPDAFPLLSGIALASATGALVWGFTGGQRRVDTPLVRIAVPGLPAAREGLTLAQISDLHIGNGLEGARLDAMVARTNALGADAIILTGDLFDFDPRFIEEGVRGLSALSAPLGVYAVLGNHDQYTGNEEIARAFARDAKQIRLLRGDYVRLDGEGALYLAGVDDPGKNWSAKSLELPDLDRVARTLPQDGPRLLLVHRPEAFPQAVRLGFDVVFAGHTHGGQLGLGRGGRWNFAQLISAYPRGHYRDGASQLYVHRGTGVAGPALRLNCSREITRIVLEAA